MENIARGILNIFQGHELLLYQGFWRAVLCLLGNPLPVLKRRKWAYKISQMIQIRNKEKYSDSILDKGINAKIPQKSILGVL
jgi:hypothetical protein